MHISERQNRYYHGAVLREAFDALDAFDLIYHDPETGKAIAYVDQTGRPFRLVKGLDYTTLDELKQKLKFFNLEYPRDSNGYPRSTREITKDQVNQHINFIVQVLIDNGMVDAIMKF